MKNLKRKLTAAILSVLLATSSFTAAPISVTAATSEETEIQETATPEKEQEEAVGYAEFTYGDYQYSIDPDDGTAVIENYVGDEPEEPELTIPSSIDGHQVSKIGSYVFYNERKIKKVTIPKGVTEIGDYAFVRCHDLEEVIIPDGVVFIGKGAFMSSPLKEIDIPKSVETIDEYAFASCSKLESVEIGNQIGIDEIYTKIGKAAFKGCSNLSRLYMGENVRTIKDEAFSSCGLKTVIIPNNTKVINDYAFLGCSDLEYIRIGYGLSKLGEDVFRWCQSLKNIYVQEGNEYFFTANGSFYGNEEMLFGNGELEYDENGVVTKVYENSDLIWCPRINEEEIVTIPEGVKRIKSYAFQYTFLPTYNVNSLYINKDLGIIEDNVFDIDAKVDIYYNGTETQWNRIKGAKTWSWTKGATNYYYCNGLTLHFLDPEAVYGHLYISGDMIDGIETEFKESWFEDNSYYNHDLAKLCSEMVVMGYHADELDHPYDLYKSLEELGFSDWRYNMKTGRDQQNYFFASKSIRKAGKDYNLVFCGCIGSHGKQWNSDFDPWGVGSSTVGHDTSSLNHKGFIDAKNYIRENLSDYFNENNYDKDNTILLLTGHSRGAAAANLLAAEILDKETFVTADNLLAYTFATPNCTCSQQRFDAKYYDNCIYNIVFPTDFVTKVLPTSWGYGKYGITRSLPTKTNDIYYNVHKENMLKKYKLLNNGDDNFKDYDNGEETVANVIYNMTQDIKNLPEYYNNYYGLSGVIRFSLYGFFQNVICPFVNGSDTTWAKIMAGIGLIHGCDLFKTIIKFFKENQNDCPRFKDAHKAETYCAFMLALDSKEVVLRNEYVGKVNCPVDIEITEKESGEVVGRIVNNTVDEEIAAKPNSVVMTVDGDEKEFWLPGNGEYDVRLIGNDNGVMDYTVREIDPDTGETNRVNYYNVPVEKDKAYTDFFTSEKAFVITAENGSELTPDEAFNSENEVSYSVTVTAEGSGTASDSLTVPSGDYVTLTASPVESEFLGWYQNDTLVSTDLEYRFRPTEDISLTAKFTGEDLKPVEFGDVDVDGEVTISDATQIQMYLAELVELEDVQVLLSDYNLDGSVDISDATQIQLKLAELI